MKSATILILCILVFLASPPDPDESLPLYKPQLINDQTLIQSVLSLWLTQETGNEEYLKNLAAELHALWDGKQAQTSQHQVRLKNSLYVSS